MLDLHAVYLLGYASGVGGSDARSGEGPLCLRQSPYFSICKEKGLDIQWHTFVQPIAGLSALENIQQQCQTLASSVSALVQAKQFFTVFGGDHSSAIGTWSGAADALDAQGPIGLIWIDAHMDSHTPETSMTGNIHGMPLACLLGFGDPSLVNIMQPKPKLKPEHLCLIGVRSYEQDEAELLKRLNVRVFFMNEIKERGMNAVMQEAIHLVTRGTVGFGVSIDIDSMDPIDAPATGVAEPDGIPAQTIQAALTLLAGNPHLIGAEIAEFDPHRDKNQITEKLIPRLINAIIFGK